MTVIFHKKMSELYGAIFDIRYHAPIFVPEKDVARKYIFGIVWRRYGPKRDILDYWGTIIFCLLSYYILSKDKCL